MQFKLCKETRQRLATLVDHLGQSEVEIVSELIRASHAGLGLPDGLSESFPGGHNALSIPPINPRQATQQHTS